MIHIMTPEVCLETCKKKLSKSEKTAFLWSLLIGLMTHFYVFTNKLYNYDELYSTPGSFGVGKENNRWFLELLGHFMSKIFGGSYSLPLFNGGLALILLAVSSVLIVRMFEVKSRILAGVIGGFLVSFPAVTCMFFFMYTSVFYSISIFFSILSAYLVIKFPENFVCNVVSIALLACSLGIYQAYFPNTVSLFVISVILMGAFGEKGQTWKRVLLRGLHYVLVLVLGMAVYFTLNLGFKSYWRGTGSMADYQGMESMGEITVDELMRGIKLCYYKFIGLAGREVMYLNTAQIVRKSFWCIFLLLGGSALFLLLVKRGEWGKKLLMLAGFVVFPIALFLVHIMAPTASIYTLMGYPVVFLLVFMAVWVDRFYREIGNQRIVTVGMQWLAMVLSTLILFVYVWYGNGCYMSLEYTKSHDLAYFETMVTQIKSLEGYKDDMPVVFVGNEIEDSTNRVGSLLQNVFPMDGKLESNVNAYSRVHIITKYLGFTPEIVGDDSMLEWMKRREVKEMNSYPNDGSIRIIDGTIIVKLSMY